MGSSRCGAGSYLWIKLFLVFVIAGACVAVGGDNNVLAESLKGKEVQLNGRKRTLHHGQRADSESLDSGTCGDGLTWYLYEEDDNKYIEIEGEGEMSNFSENDVPWLPYRTSVVWVFF